MLMALYATKLVHITAAAAWFGHKLLIPRDLFVSLESEHRALVPRIERAARLGIATGLATLTSGVVLVLLSGGFAAVPLRINVALGLVLLMFVVGAAGA